MKTRAQQRNAAQEADKAADGDKLDTDSLIRPSIRAPIRSVELKAESRSKNTKTIHQSNKSLNESVTRKDRPIYKTSLNASEAEDNQSYSSSDKSESESDVQQDPFPYGPNYRSGVTLSSSKDEEETDKAGPQQRKDEDELHLFRLRQRKGKLEEKEPLIKDQKKHQMKSRNTTFSHVEKKQANAKETKPEVYSDEELEEQPKACARSGTPYYLENKRSSSYIYIIPILVLGLSLMYFLHSSFEKVSSKKAEDDVQIMNSFNDKFRKLQILFPSQSQHLWLRSHRMLEVHLRRAEKNKEPAIILLTAAQDAKNMLYCVGNQLAKAYASSHNSSHIVLSEMDTISNNSAEVKINIDRRLNEGLKTNKAAVLHQIESWPPGSLLILYKYCDHENAAFPNVALVLTVLLNNLTLSSNVELGELEDTVYDFLQKTLLGTGTGRSHNDMDGDKLSGVWSRISHVVLPVLPEKHMIKVCEEPKTNPELEDKKPAPKVEKR